MSSQRTAANRRPESALAHSLVEGLVPQGRWRLDRERSRIGFRVKKMGVYYVKGSFRRFQGSLQARGGGDVAAEAAIEAASIHTGVPPRDAHLRTHQFLDARRSPQIRFRMETVETTQPGAFRVRGMIEIRGVARQIELHAHTHALPGAPSPRPTVIHLQGILKRQDFGVRPPQPFEMIVGDNVHLDVELALDPKP